MAQAQKPTTPSAAVPTNSQAPKKPAAATAPVAPPPAVEPVDATAASKRKYPVRPPVQRAFGQVQDVIKTLQRLTKYATAWTHAPGAGPVRAHLSVLTNNLKHGLVAAAAVEKTIHALHEVAFNPPEAQEPKPRKFAPGVAVVIKAGPVFDRWAKIVDDVADLDNLVVAKVVDSNVVVDIGPDDNDAYRRLGVLFRGNLAIKDDDVEGDDGGTGTDSCEEAQ